MQMLLGAVLVVQSDSSRKEGPELPSAEIVSCRGWDSCTSSDDSLSIILLSPTTCIESRRVQEATSQNVAGLLDKFVRYL